MNDNIRFAGEWQLKSTSIAAVRFDGVAIVKSGLDLLIVEGRSEQYHLVEDEDYDNLRPVMAYELSFHESNSKEPDNSEQSEAAIILTGQLEDGRPCKIWGDGYVGFDNHEQLEGVFWSPPRIELIEADEPFLRLDPDDEAAGHGPR